MDYENGLITKNQSQTRGIKKGEIFMKEIRLDSPLNGQLIELKDVKDPAFASGAMGKGAAVKDPDGKVYSPVDGTVTVLFGTPSASMLRTARTS